MSAASAPTFANLPKYDRPWHRVGRWLLRGVIGGLLKLFGRLRAEGWENVPETGAFILAPNHLSAVDWPAVGFACPRELYWMAKDDLFNVPLVGPFARLFHAFPVRRGAADRASLRLAEALLQAGHPLVIFPEGAVSETGEFQPLKPGLALIALRTRVPVVPTGLIGTDELLPYGHHVPHFTRRPVIVRFGPPLRFDDLYPPDAEGLPPRAAIDTATTRLAEAMRALQG